MEHRPPDTRSEDDGKPKRHLACPKCKTPWPTLDEVYGASIQWVWDADTERYTCNGENFGSISGVTATCEECGYFWTLRKAQQITSVLTVDF